jgi:hypothetical protein
MPFSDTEHRSEAGRINITGPQWSHIFEHWIKRAVESYKPGAIVCKRSSATAGNFVKGIVEDLDSADLVVADLTGSKPNVYYELGVRHALCIGTIIITQDIKALPADLTNYYVFQYDYSDKTHQYDDFFAKFEKAMHEKLKAWDDTENPSDSPVSDFLGLMNQRRGKEVEQEKEKLRDIFAKLKEYFAHNFEICEAILAKIKHENSKESDRLHVIDVFAIDTILMHLIGYNWKHIKGDGLDAVEKIIVYHRRIFNEVSMTWNALHADPIKPKPELVNYLLKLLELLSEEKKRFDKEWDAHVNPAIESIKLVKRGKQ